MNPHNGASLVAMKWGLNMADMNQQYKIIVAYRDDSEAEPQWKMFTGADKEEVRERFEEFAIVNHVYSVREVNV